MSDKSQISFRVILYFIFAAVILSVFILYIFLSRPVEYVDRDIDGVTMGTIYSVRVHNFPKRADWGKFAIGIQDRLDQIEQKMSLFKSDSDISRFNISKSLDWFPVSSATAEVVFLSVSLSSNYGGVFDITSAPLVSLWGFGVERRRRSIDEIRNEVAKVKDKIGSDKLAVRLDPPAIKKSISELQIDLSAVAKGYAVDVISRYCEDFGLADYMIDVGGEICCMGGKGKDKDWRVGVELPVIIPRGEWGGIYQVMVIGNQCMATSGGNRNFKVIDGKYYSHLIDPRTCLPCQLGDEDDLATGEWLGAVSVLDKSCARADALATAFFVLGATDGLKVANERGVPVLFLVRKGNEIKEIASDSFYKSAKKIKSR
ncbi:MAG: FAD:protein FMN transferase [Planctomycetaceae bacterium]|jgi:thiamine biosynthesis lipoprotein|nr:FAD:protein FMN transferase [Planctomycetaceae bacterium]